MVDEVAPINESCSLLPHIIMTVTEVTSTHKAVKNNIEAEGKGVDKRSKSLVQIHELKQPENRPENTKHPSW